MIAQAEGKGIIARRAAGKEERPKIERLAHADGLGRELQGTGNAPRLRPVGDWRLQGRQSGGRERIPSFGRLRGGGVGVGSCPLTRRKNSKKSSCNAESLIKKSLQKGT